jgi:hypothetical protein
VASKTPDDFELPEEAAAPIEISNSAVLTVKDPRPEALNNSI